MSGKRKRIQNDLFLNNVSQGFLVRLFRFVRRYLPALRCCFLEMRHCWAGWVEMAVGRARAPQRCVWLLAAVTQWDIALHSSTVAPQFRHTKDHRAQFRWHWVFLPSSFRHLLQRSFQNNGAQERLWDRIAGGHLLPKTTGGLLPLF